MILIDCNASMNLKFNLNSCSKILLKEKQQL